MADSKESLGDRSPGRRKRLLFWLPFPGALIFVVLAAGATWRHMSAQAQQNAAKGPPPALPVTVARAVRRDVPVYFDPPGTVQALNTVAIRPPSSIRGRSRLLSTRRLPRSRRTRPY